MPDDCNDKTASSGIVLHITITIKKAMLNRSSMAFLIVFHEAELFCSLFVFF
jgi:hypothetical protein